MIDFQPGDIVTWSQKAGSGYAVKGERLTVLGPSPKRDCVLISGASRLKGGESVHVANLVPVVPEAAAAADVPTVITGTTTKMVWPD